LHRVLGLIGGAEQVLSVARESWHPAPNKLVRGGEVARMRRKDKVFV